MRTLLFQAARLWFGLVWFGLVWFLCLMTNYLSWFIKYHTHLCRYGTFEPVAGRVECVYTFLKCGSQKLNVIVRLEFELGYYNVTVQHVSRYVTGFPTYPGWLLVTVDIEICLREIIGIL